MDSPSVNSPMFAARALRPGSAIAMHTDKITTMIIFKACLFIFIALRLLLGFSP